MRKKTIVTATVFTMLLMCLTYAAASGAATSLGKHPLTPAPTKRPANASPVSSFPPDLKHYSRPAKATDVSPVSGVTLPPGYRVADVVVANTDSSLASSDTFPDGEPSIAVNGSNPNQIAITAFSSPGWGSGNAPVWYSTDGGTTWTKQFTITKPTGISLGSRPDCPCDQTIDFDRSSNLFGTFLTVPGGAGTGDVYSGDTTNPASAASWQWFTSGGVAQHTDTLASGADNADQPQLRMNRDPTTAAQDNTYVGYDDFTSPATLQVAVAPGTRPPNFTRNHSAGSLSGLVNPGSRLAPDPRNGTIYAIFQFATGTNADGSKAVAYIINRSTDGGNTWSLNSSSGGVSIGTFNSDQPTPKFGTVNALLGGIDSATVDPANGDVYYVFGVRDSSTNNNRLAIDRLTTDGSGTMSIASSFFLTGQVKAALPAVAVASNGTVGVLYDTFDGTSGGFPQFSAHLAQSTDHGVTFTDTTLSTFTSPATDNSDPGQRVLGDYQQLRAFGNTFYGTFSGNGASFGRSTSNIDPIFFSAPAASTSTGYPRPKGATPKRDSLVIAYQSCTSSNASHSGGVTIQSCNPPLQTSQWLTVGTLDANGLVANFVGFTRMSLCGSSGCGSPFPSGQDFKLEANASDIRCTSALASAKPSVCPSGNLGAYSGSVAAVFRMKITDHCNTTGSPGSTCPASPGLSATSKPFALSANVSCVPGGAGAGSTCAITTTANAVVPGLITSGQRQNIAVTSEIDDGGPDGNAGTISGNTLFAEEGVFAP